MKKVTILAAAAILAAGTASARDTISIAGSSTVLPYANIVAEAFGAETDYNTPVVEGGGSSTGRRMLCEGTGYGTIDIANSSSLMKDSEADTCKANGVTPIYVRFGYDGIVFASDINGPEFRFTPADIYLALNARSTATNWQEVNSAFPNQEIQMFIPGTNHGTREVFEEKVLVEGCKAVGDFDQFMADNGGDKKAAEKQCMEVRNDGVSVDIEGDYTQTLANLDANPNGIGVFGLSFYENNTDRLQVATVDGVVPTVEAIASGEYPISRPLQFYIKKEHLDVVPGLKEYVEFFISDEISGPGGPLSEYGLVPDPELKTTQEMIKNLK
jgi:phosphate transport system substrate-binding protein